MKHMKGNFGATIPVNFQDDYAYELMHPMVGSGAYIAITKGLSKNGGNLALGHIWPRKRKMYLHNSKAKHTITEENLNKLYDLADSLERYNGTFDDIDIPNFPGKSFDYDDRTLEEKIDEADGEKDGKFSVHDMDSDDGNHDDEIDVGFLADSIMHGPGHIPHYDEDGNKIEEE